MIVGDDFYDLSSPTHLQQGDVFPDVPLISPPPSPHLIILREQDGRPWTHQPGLLLATSEQLLSNIFEGSAEYVAASAERGFAAILSQTCDLVDRDQWLVAPLLSAEAPTIDLGNLFADKYSNLFGMPRHPHGYFGAGYLDLGRCFAIRRESIDLGGRIASLTPAAQHALTDKIAEALSRVWGYAPDEVVPKAGKYRCIRCFQFYDVDNKIQEFAEGQKFPQCPACAKIKKRAQWRLLRKHEKY